MNEISVVLIEDHDLSRVGLISALQRSEGIKVVGEAASGREGLRVLQATQPNVAIVDIGLPDMDGIELTQQFQQLQGNFESQQTKVLILTMHSSEDSVMAAFAAGADSYSLKDVSLENLVRAIRLTNEGNCWIDPAIARVVLKQARKIPSNRHNNQKQPDEKIAIDPVTQEYQQIIDNAPLTHRELEVLELIVSGCNNAQISEKLYITVGTVKTHVRSILNKLCADDRTQAAVRALRSGLVQ